MLNNNDLILSDEVDEGNQDQDTLEEIPDNQGEEMQEAVEPEMEKEWGESQHLYGPNTASAPDLHHHNARSTKLPN